MKLTLLAFLLVLNIGVHAQSRVNVTVHIAPNANQDNPTAVDLVLVSDKKLLKELTKMSAKEWFSQKHQIQLDYPKETDLSAGSWEWVPGQAVKLHRIPVRRAIAGGVIFANYLGEGVHRAVINPRKNFLLTLGEKNFCVQVASEASKPCPTPK